MDKIKQILHITKFKIGKDRSHPIGAQAISQSLSNVPQFDDLSITFLDDFGAEIGVSQPGWSERPLKNSQRYPQFRELLSVHFQDNRGFDFKDWQIYIYPVERAKKSLIKTILLEIGMPAVAKWLSEDRYDTWYEGSRVLQIGINDPEEQVNLLETHNQHIIDSRLVSLNL